jgi:hypothetical protein
LLFKGEAEHRRVKVAYASTNKIGFVKQIAHYTLKSERMNAIAEQLSIPVKSARKRTSLALDEREELPPPKPEEHYQIADGVRYPISLPAWLHKNSDDPALNVSSVYFLFIPFTSLILYIAILPPVEGTYPHKARAGRGRGRWKFFESPTQSGQHISKSLIQSQGMPAELHNVRLPARTRSHQLSHLPEYHGACR